MQLADIKSVQEIDRLCPDQVRAGTPWTRKDYREELHRPQAHIDVVRADGQIMAYCNYWVVGGEVQIMNVATRPEARRRGHARQLLQQALAAGTRATLEVAEGNQPAIALYRSLGFQVDGRRAGYYQASGKQPAADALLMSLTVPQ